MSNTLFPVLPGVKKGSRTKTPIFETKVQKAVSGRELRTSYSAYPRWQYALEYEYLRAAQQYQDWQTLLGFFLARGGDFDSWLYDDPDDNAATDQIFAIGDGITKTFRLVRDFGDFIEPVAAVNGPPLVKVGGVAAAPVVNAMAATVTFAVAPADGAVLSWSGSFFFRCRFLQGRLEFKRFMQNFWSASKVEFISIK